MKTSSLTLLLAALAALAGCGGSSHGSSGPTGSVAGKEACVFAQEAKNAYHHAALVMGLDLTDNAKVHATFEAVGGFQAALRRLARYGTHAQAEQLNRLVTDLERQVKVLEAIRHRELAAARQVGAGLNESLSSSLQNFEAICRNA